MRCADGRDVSILIRVPDNALYYAALGCVEVGLRENAAAGLYTGRERLKCWIEEGQYEEKKKIGRGGLCKDDADLSSFKEKYEKPKAAPAGPQAAAGSGASGPVVAGLRFRLHDRQGCVHVPGERTALLLLRAEQGQSHRRRQVAVPAGSRPWSATATSWRLL